MARRSDGKAGRRPFDGPPREGRRRPPAGGAGGSPAEWLWGRHAVEAALANPARRVRRLLAVEAGRTSDPRVELLPAAELARLLPSGVPHQGMALLADPPEPTPLEAMAAPAEGVLVMLDQVTDPQNVGSIFRSAAAFGARGLILQDRNAPTLTGSIAKAAAGALDVIPHARVVNLARALDDLEELGWRAVGLAGGAEQALEQVLDDRPTVLVLGSEGEGLRRLVAERCEALARIPMPGGFESLNVANAAAVALYAAHRARAAQSAGENG